MKNIHLSILGSKLFSNILNELELENLLHPIGQENFNINTLNLKSRRLVYATTMSKSYGSEDYTFNVIVEWKSGFYQIIPVLKVGDSNAAGSFHLEFCR